MTGWLTRRPSSPRRVGFQPPGRGGGWGGGALRVGRVVTAPEIRDADSMRSSSLRPPETLDARGDRSSALAWGGGGGGAETGPVLLPLACSCRSVVDGRSRVAGAGVVDAPGSAWSRPRSAWADPAFGTPLAFVLARRRSAARRWSRPSWTCPSSCRRRSPAWRCCSCSVAWADRPRLEVVGVSLPFTTLAVILAQPSSPHRSSSAPRAPGSSGSTATSRTPPAWTGRRSATCSAASPRRWPGRRSPPALVMSWSRALGEFGATIMFAGNIEGRPRPSRWSSTPSSAAATSSICGGRDDPCAGGVRGARIGRFLRWGRALDVRGG